MKSKYKTIQTDVLVIGSGGAGLRTAIELHDNKTNVLMVGKCEQRNAHTVLATGGINAALKTMDQQDSWQLHAADTLRDGGEINDPQAVMTLCKNAPKAVQELATWGAQFHRESNGKITQRFFGAATYRRACFVGDQTGKSILNTLVNQVLKRKIKFHSEVYIFSLLKSSNKASSPVNGAIGIDIKTGTIIIYHTKSIILATGGFSRVFARSSSRSFENNGDGIKLAYDVGVSFMDMEMFQFHPTGMVYPTQAEGILVTEAVRGEGGILTNANGERFMEKYDKERMELSARDIVARAIYLEAKAGNATARGGVYLDISHQPKSYIKQRLPQMFEQFKKFCNIDISKQKMEVAPTAHYSMGGILVDHTTGKTAVNNLYAIGEVTSGVHGANRLGGNSLAEIIVFGRLTGNHVAHDVKNIHWLPLDRTQINQKIATLTSNRGKNPIIIKTELQKLMWENCGVARNGKDLKKALSNLQKYQKMNFKTGTPLKNNKKLIAALDVHAMIPTCELILKSALARTESRGAHYRTDYPKTSKKWRKSILCVPTKSSYTIKTKSIPSLPKELKMFMNKQIKSHLLE